MKNQKRELLTKKLEAAKKEVRMKEEKVRDILTLVDEVRCAKVQQQLSLVHLFCEQMP